MNMLARKISRAKWSPKAYLQSDEISADAVTGCLRTTDDSLSWWRCTGDRADVAEVALALACKMQRFEKIDLVALPDTELEPIGVETRATDGDTPVKGLRSRHVDLIHLDLERLARLARTLARRIRSDSDAFVFMFTKRDLIELVRDGVLRNRVSAQDLDEKLRRQLQD